MILNYYTCGKGLLHLWEISTKIIYYTCGKSFITFVGKSIITLWEAFITFVGNYYTCGKRLLHLWEIITFVKIITFVGVTGPVSTG